MSMYFYFGIGNNLQDVEKNRRVFTFYWHCMLLERYFDLNFKALEMVIDTRMLLFEWLFTAVYRIKQREMFSALCVLVWV